jgi:hypothetical protein
MAGCILLGEHCVTIEFDTDPGETDMLIKSGESNVQFYVDDLGNLVITYSGPTTIGGSVIGVVPSTTPAYAVYEWFGDCECCATDERVSKVFKHIVDAIEFASRFARDHYSAEVDVIKPDTHYELDTDAWSGYVAVEVRGGYHADE